MRLVERLMDSVRWLESLVADPPVAAERTRTGTATLPVGLPGGARLEISEAGQVPLARALERTKG